MKTCNSIIIEIETSLLLWFNIRWFDWWEYEEEEACYFTLYYLFWLTSLYNGWFNKDWSDGHDYYTTTINKQKFGKKRSIVLQHHLVFLSCPFSLVVQYHAEKIKWTVGCLSIWLITSIFTENNNKLFSIDYGTR